MNYFIENNTEEEKFELSIEGYTAFVDYQIDGNTITFIHTEVPFPLKGKGVASALAEYVLEYARENELWVIPHCPFIRSYIRKNEEYQSLVSPGFRL